VSPARFNFKSNSGINEDVLTNVFFNRIDANEGGYREYLPYIYLLPYWMGRYIGVIGPEVE
jgi:hypothetical protein